MTERMIDGDDRPPVPDWVGRAQVPTWVCDHEGRITYANERARRLIGSGAAGAERVCRLCAREGEEHPAACPLGYSHCALDSMTGGSTPQPLLVDLAHGQRSSRWVLIVPIRLDPADAPAGRVVFCGYELDALVRAEAYLECLAGRTHPYAAAGGAPLDELTPREMEVLELLARDEDRFAIARALHLSSVTVRNHIQNLLRKLDAHSVQEAVALYVLEADRG